MNRFLPRFLVAWTVLAIASPVAFVFLGTACNAIFGLEERFPFPPEAGAAGAGGASACEPGAVEDCYAGPADTEGIGICRAGTKTCDAEGLNYSACEGEVSPGVETCASDQDEDCDGQDCVLWGKLFGDVSDQTVGGIAVTKEGDVYIAGTFSGTLAFDPAKPLGANGTDIYLAKFDALGNPLWSKSFMGTGYPDVMGVAVDPFGNVILTGTFDTPITFGGATHSTASYQDVYVAKFGPSGIFIWSNSSSHDELTRVGSVDADSAGNVILVGTGHYDSGQPPTSHLWVEKYDAADGTFTWGKKFVDDFPLEGRTAGGVAIDSFDNILITGSFQLTENFGGGLLTSAGGFDAFVAKFDPAGNHVWSASYGNAADQAGIDIASDASGNVVMLGTYAGSVNFGGADDPLTAVGSNDIFLVKFSSAKVYFWSRSFGGAGDQQSGRVVVDKDSNILFTGRTTWNVDYGGGPLIGGGAVDLPLVKLGADGAHLWSRLFGDDLDQVGRGIAVGPGGEPLLVGNVRGGVNVGAEDLTSQGGDDILIGKFAP